MLRSLQTSRYKWKGSEKAQSLVELSLGIVIFFILLGGMVDLGRAIYTLFALQDAAEEGVVYGVGFPKECGQIFNRVRSNLSDDLLPSAVITLKIKGAPVDCGPYEVVYGDKMEIFVTADFTITMPFLGALTGQTIPLTGSANGVILRPQPEETP